MEFHPHFLMARSPIERNRSKHPASNLIHVKSIHLKLRVREAQAIFGSHGPNLR